MENKQIFLVGSTGFVGSNLLYSYPSFSMVANSKNVMEMYGKQPDVLIYAGVTGTKWYALGHEQEDWEIIENAKKNIINIAPRKLILISTVDVYDNLEKVDETYINNLKKLHVYGKHRLLLEKWVEENINDYHIVRLPAIYGMNLKKNFIYDLIHLIPGILTEEKISLIEKDIDNIRTFYVLDSEGLYHLDKDISKEQRKLLKTRFENIDNNALMFTNSESEYQFYNLKNLWKHLLMIIEKDIKVINLVTEPVSAGEVYSCIYDREFINLSVGLIKYHINSIHASEMAGKNHYFYTRNEVLEDIKEYVGSWFENEG